MAPDEDVGRGAPEGAFYLRWQETTAQEDAEDRMGRWPIFLLRRTMDGTGAWKAGPDCYGRTDIAELRL
jgi:hypothetical protein